MTAPQISEAKARFLELLTRALDGWHEKILLDFSEASFDAELSDLLSDEVYKSFGLAEPEYVLIRLMGRVSISVGRRLGELYDNLPKFVAATRFGLTPEEVAEKIDNLKLDVYIPFDKLTKTDLDASIAVVQSSLGLDASISEGLGIEIRYNFNPNDSARLRKDVAMAEGLIARNLVPIYLVYSGISPREEAMDRLTRAGWNFLVAGDASTFTKELLGLDLAKFFEDKDVKNVIADGVDRMMVAMMESVAFSKAVDSARERQLRIGSTIKSGISNQSTTPEPNPE